MVPAVRASGPSHVTAAANAVRERDEARLSCGLGERTNRLLVEEVDGVLLLGHLGPLALIDGAEPRDHAADGPASKGVRAGQLPRGNNNGAARRAGELR